MHQNVYSTYIYGKTGSNVDIYQEMNKQTDCGLSMQWNNSTVKKRQTTDAWTTEMKVTGIC